MELIGFDRAIRDGRSAKAGGNAVGQSYGGDALFLRCAREDPTAVVTNTREVKLTELVYNDNQTEEDDPSTG